MASDYRKQTKPWYGTAQWKQRRASQLAMHPLCSMCLTEGRTTAATIADHVEPHKGDPVKFWQGALDSLCKRHHDSDKQSIEKGGKAKPAFGADGWPITS